MKKIFILVTILLVAFVSNAQIRYLKGVLSAGQEGPGVTSPGSGVVIVRYNMTTKMLEHWGNYKNLVGDRNNQHIHVGAPGVSGPPVVDLTGTGTKAGTLTGSKVLTPTQEADLLAGNMYTNVHSTTYNNGELRAQLTPTTDGQTVLLNARLQGAQEVPPNPSQATGSVNVLVDKTKDSVWVTGDYTGLTTAASDAHIHTGAPNASGPPAIFLKFVAATSGTLDTATAITATDETNILSGNTYVNVHTSTYTGGEIRGQILAATLLRYFANAMTGSQEVPPNASTARGTVIVRYNTETNLLELWGDYQNLTSTISGSHIHGPAAPNATAGVVVNLTNTGGTMGTLTASQIITEPQEADLLNGLWYVNVHSNPPPLDQGEIRGQLLPLSSGETQFLTAGLDVDEERAAMPLATITSSATGTAVAVLDKITRNIYLTGSYSNITSGIRDAHIHRGPVAVSGPVSVQLQFMPTTTSGTITGSMTNITASLMDSIISGNSYVNIHSDTYRPGEIRGQLGNLVLPVKLAYFNAYKDQNKVALIWSAPQEVNLVSYDIEQQNLETKEWTRKATIAAKGGSGVVNYRLNDVPTLGKGSHVIYRLKMNEANGQFSYSSAIRINFRQSLAELMILANPVSTGVLRYTITGLPVAGKAEVSIVDFNGRTVSKTSASSLMTNEINIRNLSAGTYKLVVRLNDLLLQQSFVK